MHALRRRGWKSSEDKERELFEEWAQGELKEQLRNLVWVCSSCNHEENPIHQVACSGCDEGRREGKLRVFIRHGEGEHNTSIWKAIRLRDPTLTPKGIWQAQTLGAALKQTTLSFDKIVVSPLTRTIQTAKLVFDSSACPFELCPTHAEYFEPRADCNLGRQPALLAEDFPEIRSWGGFSDLDPVCWWPTKETDVGWETWRTEKFAMDLWSADTSDNVAVVGHGGFFRVLLDLERTPKNCGVVVALQKSPYDLNVLLAQSFK